MKAMNWLTRQLLRIPAAVVLCFCSSAPAHAGTSGTYDEEKIVVLILTTLLVLLGVALLFRYLTRLGRAPLDDGDDVLFRAAGRDASASVDDEDDPYTCMGCA